MEPVRWGVLGAGKHFRRRILFPMMKSQIIDICGISGRKPEKLKEFSDNFAIKVYSSYSELLSDPKVEAVFISLPNNMHFEWIEKAADAGKHILCEKPITLDSISLKQAIEYIGSKGVLLMEGFMYRFHPQWIRAHELVITGNIGEIQSINISYCYHNLNPENIRNMLQAGGGALYDLGCYAVSVARYLLNREPIRVQALFKHDNIFGTDVLTSGLIDFGKAHSTFVVGTQSFNYQKVWIHGSSGVIEIEKPFNTFTDVASKISVISNLGFRTIEFPPLDMYRVELERFSMSIRSGQRTPITLDETLNNMRVIDALFTSGKTDRWEYIRDV